MKTNRTKYRIVVLTDLSESLNTSLKSSVGLAKMIDGEIEVFHVRKPSEIVGQDNQLSAMRTINSKHISINKKIQNKINQAAKTEGERIPYSFVFGNVRNEISTYIKERQPDIIVLGKRKSKPFNLIGDGITEYVIKNFDGAILIANNNTVLEPNKDLALGILNSSKPFKEFDFAQDLMKHSQKPLKSFKFIKNSSTLNERSNERDKEAIEYVFEHNADAIKNLSKYLTRNNISLLSIDRAENRRAAHEKLVFPDVNNVVNSLNTTVLLSGK